MILVAAGGVPLHPQSGHRYIKWNAFPDNVWDRGVYVRLPRELVFESPNQTPEERVKNSLHAPWSEENVQLARTAMDAGEIKVLTRPPGMCFFVSHLLFPFLLDFLRSSRSDIMKAVMLFSSAMTRMERLWM